MALLGDRGSVDLVVMRKAKPPNVERAAIVVMVCLDALGCLADLARLLGQPSIPDGVADGDPGRIFLGIFPPVRQAIGGGQLPVFLRIRGMKRLACGDDFGFPDRIPAPSPVVLDVVFVGLDPPRFDVPLGAFLALIEMAIGHPGMRIEVGEILLAAAFEAAFHRLRPPGVDQANA
jgi:hypothetical protein